MATYESRARNAAEEISRYGAQYEQFKARRAQLLQQAARLNEMAAEARARPYSTTDEAQLESAHYDVLAAYRAQTAKEYENRMAECRAAMARANLDRQLMLRQVHRLEAPISAAYIGK